MDKLFFATVVFILASAVTVIADEKASPLPSHLPLGKEMCFGRVYDEAHLKRHPKQRVTSFHLFRDFSPEQNTETEPQSPEELRQNDGQDGRVNIAAYVRLRDRKGVFWNGLSCGKSERGVRCSIDCDGGSFKLRGNNASVIVDNEGFVVVGGCGASDDEQGRSEIVQPGADDKTFRLDPQPIAQCAALRDQERPNWAKLGEPLRLRLTRETCFSRTYDDAHLAKSPKQNVRAVAIRKVKPLDDAEPPIYSLNFKFTLRSGETVERASTCWPDNYAYTCGLQSKDGESNIEFSLTRAGGNHIMLRDRKGALGKVFPRKLGADDRVFRLQAAQDCPP